MDRAKLLEAENAALKIVARYESILDPRALPDLLTILREFAEVTFAAITIPDGAESFRTLVVSSPELETILPYRTSIPNPKALFDTVAEAGQPYFAPDLSAGHSIDKLAEGVGVRSYAVYPVRHASGTRPFGGMVLGFVREGAHLTLPPEVGVAIAIAIAGSVERGLAASRERRAVRILDASRDAMLAWDHAGSIIDVNAAALEMCGATREELCGSNIADYLGSVPRAPSSAERFTLARRDGRGVPVAGTVSLVTGDPLVTAHALLRDLSEVVAAERYAAERLTELRALTEQHTLLLDNAPLLIFRIDPVTERLLYLNRHAERLFGVAASRALETPGFLRDLHADAEGAAAFEEAFAAACDGRVSAPYEARLELVPSVEPTSASQGPRATKGPPPESIIARGTIYPHLGADGKVTAIEGILLDVSGERAARSRLLQADRLATVGMLAAGVAHEINNPAAFMLLGLDALGRQLARVELADPARAVVTQLVEDLRETGRRIVDIARDMRLFASPPKNEIGRLTVVDVGRSIESALTITRAQIVEKADIELDLAEDLPPVAMDEGRLGQVLVNLLVNAAQAIAEARLTRTIPIKGDRVRVTSRADGDRVVITVEDTGVGMSEKVLARLFTPFYTTKGPDAGTGLGLAISKAILARAGGTITATSPSSLSDPPRGSRFEIRLPAFMEEVVSAPRGDARSPGSRRGSVLIVEDEVLLGRALAEFVREHHDVRLASGGEEALEILRSKRFDAVLCDLKMPGMGGEGLYKHLLEVDPDQARRFVFMTGVGFGADIERIAKESSVTVLEKPFPMEQALAAIATIVTRSA